jgi:hypothetical protein
MDEHSATSELKEWQEDANDRNKDRGNKKKMNRAA